MAGAPAFQFYASDFLAGTTFMSAAAVGCYMRMICQSWESGPIPDHPTALHKAMGLGPADPPFDQMWEEIQGKWQLKKGGWISPRLEQVRRNQEAFRKRQQEAGRISGKKRRELSAVPAFNRRSNTGSTTVATIGEPEGQPNTNSLISDLRSPISDLRSSDTEHAPAIVNGRELRQHGQHAWCSWPQRDGLCVPAFLHREFVGKLGTEDAEARLKGWYPSVVAKFDQQPIGDDALRFWRNEFAAWVGTVTSAPREGKGQHTVAAVQRGLARYAEMKRRGDV